MKHDKRPIISIDESGSGHSIILSFARWKPLTPRTRARLSRIVAKLLTEINKEEAK